MSTNFKYKIMFDPSVRNIFVLRNYFETFGCSVLISKSDEERKANAKSLIGWLSLDLQKYNTITLFFDNDVNTKDIKSKLDLIEM